MSDEIFRKIVEETAHVAIILLDEAGKIILWNAGAEAIFGYGSAEAIGLQFEMIFIAADRENGIPARELARARESGRAEDTRWHLRKDGRRFFADGVTTIVRGEDGRISGFVKFARDITERHQAERRLAAQLSLTSLLSEELPFEKMAGRIMQTVCENLSWDLGALWEVRGETIDSIDFWHSPHVNAAEARELCGPQSLPRAVGFPGLVAEKREPLWVFNFGESSYPRAPAARRAGMRGAFGFPIVRGSEAIGVMEFFSSAERDPDQALMPVMTLIGTQIGDFIERRRTHDALRESEELYRLVSETAQDAIFTIDEVSTVTFCNPAVERLFGWRPEELIGRPLSTIIPERLRQAHERGIQRFLRTRTPSIPWNGVELPALHRDGHEFPCEISFGEWNSGERTIFTGFARDVSERKRTLELEKQARAEAEAARAQLERRAEEEAAFRHLASALTGAAEMTDVLFEITNRATQVTRADGVYVERISTAGGTRSVEVVSASGRGTPRRGLRVDFPGSMTDEILRGSTPVILTSMESFGKSMTPYLSDTCPQCEVLVTPITAENEPLGALVLLNSASSGRRFGEGDIIRARTLGDLTSLALRRVRLLEEERAAKERAEAAVRVRDETLGIVSHDLRNPLTKMTLSADLLLDAPPDEQGELIETIRSSARQMERLIQDLLDVARLESGGFSVNRDSIDPEPVVHEACSSNEAIAAQKHQSIVCRIPSELPRISADRGRLAQVFSNLLGNAMKFSPDGGSIMVEASLRGEFVEFVVRDHGPGIPEAEIGHLFTPYWQSKKTAHMGAGLGLAIVRGIVQAHGGQVWAENAPGGGAMFTFTLPRESTKDEG